MNANLQNLGMVKGSSEIPPWERRHERRQRRGCREKGGTRCLFWRETGLSGLTKPEGEDF